MGISSGIAAGKAFLRLLVDDDEFAKGLDVGLKKLEGFGKSAIKVGASIGAVGAAITAPFIAAVASFEQVGSALNDMSERTGLSVEKLSELQFAAGQTGTSMEAIERALKTLARNGENVENFDQIVKSIAAIPDPSQRAAVAMERLGKTGTQLLPMAAQLDELHSKFEKLGIGMSTEQAKAADDLGDAFASLKLQFAAVANAVGAALAPALTVLVDKFSEILPTVIQFVGEHKHLVTAIAAAGGALIGIGAVITAFGTVVYGARKAVIALRLALIALAKNPVAIVGTIAMIALTFALGSLIDKWLDSASATNEAADSMKSFKSVLDEEADAVAKGTKQIDLRAEALKRLTQAERDALNREKERQQNKEITDTAGNLRGQAAGAVFSEDLDRIKKEIANDAKLIAEANDKNLPELRKANEAALQKQIATFLTNPQFAFAFGAGRPLGNLGGDFTGEKHGQPPGGAPGFFGPQIDPFRLALTQFPDIIKQVQSTQRQLQEFTRPTRGGIGGQFAEQILGKSSSQNREERMLKAEENTVTLLERIEAAIKNIPAFLVGSS